ncbi:hypothetical protein [Streptomyces coeruleorubidus]|uniref:hypothetical protein n=1 Tax=Streptomyces coeruleorubidus TaxID=116188 RepID=UPI00167E8B72|nr:hypothetical protein [Streptomyces coeruleorubidus]GGU11190.1 hypothetical protein GCM10010256_83300 [Streptomyces coeruleorubidus]
MVGSRPPTGTSGGCGAAVDAGIAFGYLIPPGDVRALADRLMELLDDPAARRRMGEAGREIVTGHDTHRTLAAFEAFPLPAAGHPAATTPPPSHCGDGKRAR